MELVRIEIPQHVRKIKLSDKRRPIYFEWNGVTIFAKKRLKIPKHFYRDPEVTTDNIMIEHLKSGFFIAKIHKKKKKVVGFITENSKLPTPMELVNDREHNYMLYSNETGSYKPVIANKATVGTPNMYLINGQDIYSGATGDFMLQTVMNAIKENFRPYVRKIAPITDYPIDIFCEIHDTIKNPYGPSREDDEIGQRWDVDNYAYPY